MKEMIDIKIDNDIKELLTPLTDSEKEKLQESIIAYGCRDPLVVWNDILLDGHNRLDVCSKYKIKFDRFDIKLKNKKEALLWVAKNQLGRRNLSNWHKAKIGLSLKPQFKAKAKINQGSRTDLLPKNAKCVELDTINARDEIAKTVDVSGETIRKAEYILAHKDYAPEIIAQLDRGDLSINAAFERIKHKVIPTPPQDNQNAGLKRPVLNNESQNSIGYMTVKEALKKTIKQEYLFECVLAVLLADDQNDRAEVKKTINDLRHIMLKK